MTSTRSDRVRQVASLSGRSARERQKQFRVEGPQAVRALLTAQPAAAVALFMTDEARSRHADIERAAAMAALPVTPVTAEVITAMVRDQGQQSVVSPQGIIATARMTAWNWRELLAELDGTPPERPLTLVAADRIQDPGNAGMLLRTADASGAAAVFFGEGSADPFSPKVVRSTAGSLFHLPIATRVPLTELIQALRQRGIACAATSGYAAQSLFDFHVPARLAWLMGNEAHGLTPDLLAGADHQIAIPLQGRAESLNLAAAATLCLFESARQHPLSD